MIKEKDLLNQLPNNLKADFKELKLLKHLKRARIIKYCDYSGKDTVYRFLNPPIYAWINMIGMVKQLKQLYIIDDKKVSLKELYRLETPTTGKKEILRSIQTTQANGVRVKIIFVRNHNKKGGIG
ncbi:hypothetical protein JCM21714_4228 [Gracilibacillus boraciitolerans JCM 21714]|uniref:Uncharacterized protein n=1 Tax=Gracilibacillus boraciitolerans JCM 21714 TaxID=1298598 RepID=W4VNS5_9BACI|nr:hypothetical protein [Gracilibacillus boraciitolerans]GAE95025.1 hypothetical protein JCM21714_4228 [Gracilibacillus boraciitolerans JCM 21714]